MIYEFISGGGLGDDQPPEPPSPSSPGPSLLAQGRAMRDALVDALSRLPEYALTVVDCTTAPMAMSDAHTRNGAIASIRARQGESALDFMARVAPAFERVWVIAPESEAILAGLCRSIGPERWLGCTPEAIGIAASKSATLAHLTSHDIPTPLNPDSWPVPPDTPHQASRWVVKPDDGAGSEDTRIFADAVLARAWQTTQREAGRNFTLEPWIDGTPLSLSLACTDAECTLLGINRQLIEIVDGEVRYRGVQANAQALDTAAAHLLDALAQRIHRALPGLRGFVGVDLVRRPNGAPVVIEINPRLTCAFEGLPEAARMHAVRAALEGATIPAAKPAISHPA